MAVLRGGMAVHGGHLWRHQSGICEPLLRGGGQEKYIGPPAPDGTYPRDFRQGAQLVRVSASPIRYERRLSDGSLEVFAQPDAAPAGQWRRVFLTEVIDPQGQRLQFKYDAQVRLVAVTDAVGQVTTLGTRTPPIRCA